MVQHVPEPKYNWSLLFFVLCDARTARGQNADAAALAAINNEQVVGPN